MRIVVTGADGFIGRNLCVHLAEMRSHEVAAIVRGSTPADMSAALTGADFVFHLAGVNRPVDDQEFVTGNVDFTARLCATLVALRRPVPIAFASSISAALDTPYGRSKRAAEDVLEAHGAAMGAAIHVFRLPNVFGKWCRPNYNSVVATFCHNVIRDLPIRIDNPATKLRLLHVDDVIRSLVALLDSKHVSGQRPTVEPEYSISLGELAQQITAFKNCRTTLMVERVGTGLTRALYATYVSHLPVEQFIYDIPSYVDPRGSFSEMLKTADSGQFSFFTAHPGVTRGGHYHHSKTEKFLVIQGEARFRFRHLLTGELHELVTRGAKPQIVETIPGWVHDITNQGTQEMIVMLWANEVFDRANPDTIQRQME